MFKLRKALNDAKNWKLAPFEKKILTMNDFVFFSSVKTTVISG